MIFNSDTIMCLGVVFFYFFSIWYLSFLESVPGCLSLVLEKVSTIISSDITLSSDQAIYIYVTFSLYPICLLIYFIALPLGLSLCQCVYFPLTYLSTHKMFSHFMLIAKNSYWVLYFNYCIFQSETFHVVLFIVYSSLKNVSVLSFISLIVKHCYFNIHC